MKSNTLAAPPQRKPLVFSPSSPFKARWDFAIVAFTIYSAIRIPLLVGFPHDDSRVFLALDLVASLLFLLDIVVSLHTAIPARGKEITDLKSIRQVYLRKWFTLDFLAALPIHLVATSSLFPALSPLRFLALLRLGRILRLPHYFSNHRFRLLSDTAFKLLTFLFWFLLTAHIVACGWIVLDGIPADKFNDPERYLRALYWCITTLATVGYGDITPQNPPQILYTVVVMILGITIYGYVIGNVTSLLANLNVAKSLYLKQLDRVNAFIQLHGLPKNLEQRILSYQSYLWESRLGYDETEVVTSLPKDLRCDVLMHIHRDIIGKVPLFKGAPERLLREIVMELRPLVATPSEFIFQKGDEGAEMFFIRQGMVQIVSGDGGTVFATLSDGSFFGEVALLFNQPRNASVRACDYCDLYVLPRISFEKVLAKYPEFAEQIHALARERRGEQK